MSIAKKVLTLLVCVAFLAVMTACGSESQPGAGSPQATQAPIPPAASPTPIPAQ